MCVASSSSPSCKQDSSESKSKPEPRSGTPVVVAPAQLAHTGFSPTHDTRPIGSSHSGHGVVPLLVPNTIIGVQRFALWSVD